MRSSASASRQRIPATLIVLMALAVPHGAVAAGTLIPSNELDPTFGYGGVVTTDLPSFDEGITDLALQADGKILAIGFADQRFALLRYLPDGERDPEFPSVNLTFGDHVAVQPDGRIVVGGVVGMFPDNRFALARLNADGTVDRTFGREGRVVTRFATGADLDDVAVQEDGSILAVGSATGSEVIEGLLFARYDSSGRLDESFGSSGKVITRFTGDQHYLGEVAIQADGKILANAELSAPTISRLGLVRLEVDGTLDPTFDGDGKVVMEFAESFAASGLVVQPDGGIVSGGTYGIEFGAARHLPDGALDVSFGEGGVAHTVVNGLFDSAEDVDVQPNGLIVVAGWAEDEGDENDLAVVWYRPDGSLHSMENSPYLGLSSFGYAVAVQPDGKAIAAGGGGPGFDQARFGLVRFLPS